MKNNKEVVVRAAHPDQYEIYEDGSMKVWCKRCKNPEEVPEERAKKIQKIPDWSSKFTCTPCWQKTQELEREPEKQRNRDEYVKGAEWGMAYNLAFQYALKFADETDTLESMLTCIPIWQRQILAHIKELKQKTLN